MTHDIQVKLLEGRLLVYPDPAVVKVGDKVIWAFGSGGTRWTVYFHHRSPFAQERGYPDSFEASAQDSKVGPFLAEDPGDYKYGIKVEDPATGYKLADDDPRLVVQRG